MSSPRPRLPSLRLIASDTLAAAAGLLAAFLVHALLDPAVELRPRRQLSDTISALPLALGVLYACFLPAGLFREQRPDLSEVAAMLALATATAALVVVVYYGPGPRPWLFALCYALTFAAVAAMRRISVRDSPARWQTSPRSRS